MKTFGERKDAREDLIEKIIAAMEAEVKYEKPWLEFSDIPYNPTTGNAYSGMNFIMLAMSGRADPRWITFNQIKEQSKADGQNYFVRRGEKATEIVVFVPFAMKDENGEIVRNEKGKAISARDENGREKKTVKTFHVFNAEQIEGYPRLVENKEKIENFGPAEKLKRAMEGTGLKFETHGNAAYYSPSKDTISTPPIDHFKSQGHYYRTLCHEIGHSTGHPSRLERDMTGSMRNGNKDDLQKYAFEELVAELSSYFVCSQLDIKYDSSSHENHAAYLKSWISALSDKTMDEDSKVTKGKQFFTKACGLAGKSADYQLEKMYNYEMSLEKAKSKDLDLAPSIEKPAKKQAKQEQRESVMSM